MLKCAADAYFGVYLYIFTNSFDPSEAKRFVVSAFFIRKDWCEFLSLENFVVSTLMCTLFPNPAIS